MSEPPFSPDSRPSTNGSTPPDSLPLADRLPQDPQSPAPRPVTDTLSPGMKRDIRRAFLILLGAGLIIGAITAAGVVLVMNHFNLIGVPEQSAP